MKQEKVFTTETLYGEYTLDMIQDEVNKKVEQIRRIWSTVNTLKQFSECEVTKWTISLDSDNEGDECNCNLKLTLYRMETDDELAERLMLQEQYAAHRKMLNKKSKQ